MLEAKWTEVPDTLIQDGVIYSYDPEVNKEYAHLIRVQVGLYMGFDKETFQLAIENKGLQEKYRMSTKVFDEDVFGIAFCDLCDDRTDEQIWEGHYYTTK